MARPRDLTGQRYGRLTVLRQAPHMRYGARMYVAWICRCDCGAEEALPRPLLPSTPADAASRRIRRACTSCTRADKRRPCARCSTLFIPAHNEACCSPACHADHRRAIELDWYYRRVAADPTLNLRRHAQKQARIARDPEAAARDAAREQRRRARHQERLRSDPAYAEAFKARGRAAHARRAERVADNRRRRLAALSPEQQADLRARVQIASRQSYERRLAALADQPERRALWLAHKREILRRHLARAELAELTRIGAALIERQDAGTRKR